MHNLAATLSLTVYFSSPNCTLVFHSAPLVTIFIAVLHENNQQSVIDNTQTQLCCLIISSMKKINLLLFHSGSYKFSWQRPDTVIFSAKLSHEWLVSDRLIDSHWILTRQVSTVHNSLSVLLFQVLSRMDYKFYFQKPKSIPALSSKIYHKIIPKHKNHMVGTITTPQFLK